MAAIMLTPECCAVDADETAILTATFYDTNEDPISKLAFQSLTATLVGPNREIINDRDAQDILDNNGGVLGVDGVLKLKLSPLDNPFIGSTGLEEIHSLEIAWTWRDASNDTLTGKQPYQFRVRRFDVYRPPEVP